MNILVTIPEGDIRNTFIPGYVREKLQILGNVFWNDTGSDYNQEQLKEKIQDVDVCITGWGSPRFDEVSLSGVNRLKLVAHTGGSVAPFISEYFFDRGLRVISGNRLYAESVAEGVIGYILCALRELPFYANEVQEKRWSTGQSYSEGLLEQTVGLVGFGMVAKYLVGLLMPFRVKIKVYDPYVTDEVLAFYRVEKASLLEVMTESKIVSVHAAKAPSTYHIINKELIQKIPDGTLFVNTSRGSIIDETVLAEELVLGRFKAILDVFEEEPLPASSKLRGLANVTLIPHMAGPTVDRRPFVTLALIEDIQNYLTGNPMNHEIGREYAMSMTR